MCAKKTIYAIIICSLVIGMWSSCAKQRRDGAYKPTLNEAQVAALFKEVLDYYAESAKDSLKLKATQFLYDNLKWHKLPLAVTSSPEYIQELIHGADSVYGYITRGVNNEILTSGAMNSWLLHRSREYSRWRDTTFIFPTERTATSFKALSAEFVISHIDNAFARWETSPYAQNLSFEHFCEYILPFVALKNGSYLLNGAELYKHFSPHLEQTYPKTHQNIIARYSNYMGYMRCFTETKQELKNYNWKDIFFKKERDCVPVCEIECNVLRAMGVPTAIDMNIGNREYTGQHYHCVVFDKDEKELPFHGEGFSNGEGFSGYVAEYKLNIYRHLYGAQSNSPYMLKGENEGLPDFFNKPTIKDVTSYIKPTATQTFAIPKHVKTNLIWLYSYSREEKKGVRAITWGINDTVNNRAIFNNVVKNMVYFLAYIDRDNKVKFIGEPIAVMEGLNYKEVIVKELNTYCKDQKIIQDIIMDRKFPRKPNMLKEAQNLVGGTWYGAQHRDGKDKVKLAKIDKFPNAHLQELRLNNSQAYKFYIYEAPTGLASRFGEIEFITNDSTADTKPATPLPVIMPDDIHKIKDKRIQALTKDHTNGHEFDGNEQTSNHGKRFCYEFQTPQVITAISFAPINAENSIKPNENYQLFQWNEGWEEIANVDSEYNFLVFKNLDAGKLYWLKNNSRGQEEVPFIIANGKPRFIYYDCIQPRVKQPYKILSPTNYICTASSEEPEKGPYEPGFVKYLIDADTTNAWHSQYTGICPNYPHWIKFDTHKVQGISGVVIKLRPHQNKPKLIKISTSVNNIDWQEQGVFELRNIDTRQEVFFREKVKMRHIKFELLEGQDNSPHTSIIYLKLFCCEL